MCFQFSLQAGPLPLEHRENFLDYVNQLVEQGWSVYESCCCSDLKYSDSHHCCTGIIQSGSFHLLFVKDEWLCCCFSLNNIADIACSSTFGLPLNLSIPLTSDLAISY